MTFTTRPSSAPDCVAGNDVPREYIVFGVLVQGEIRANSVAVWDEAADQRVWTALGEFQFNLNTLH